MCHLPTKSVTDKRSHAEIQAMEKSSVWIGLLMHPKWMSTLLLSFGWCIAYRQYWWHQGYLGLFFLKNKCANKFKLIFFLISFCALCRWLFLKKILHLKEMEQTHFMNFVTNYLLYIMKVKIKIKTISNIYKSHRKQVSWKWTILQITQILLGVLYSTSKHIHKSPKTFYTRKEANSQ